MNTRLKYFEYIRKSEEGEDRQVQSIERQQEENQKIISYLKIIIIDSFCESRSAKIPNNRPLFTEMIRRIKKGEAQGIVCWHLNRIARNPFEWGIIQQLLSDGKIQSIITKDKEYLPSDNLIIIGVESSMSSQYSKDLGKSIKSGLDKKLSKGMAPLLAPIGYLNTKHEEQGARYIVKDPERFEIMRKLWELMLTGLYTPPKILEMATNEYGLRTRITKHKGGKPLARSAIYKVFTNPFYAGLFQYNGRKYLGIHEPMITANEYDKVQMILGINGKPRIKTHNFSYTGLIKCGECGSYITACEKQKLIKSTGHLKSYVFYHCTHRKNGAKNCSQKSFIRLESLETEIEVIIERFSISPLFSEWALKIVKETFNDAIKKEEVINEASEKEHIKLDREVKNLLQMRLNDSITDEEYLTERRSREMMIIRLKQKMEERKSNPNLLLKELESTFINVTQLSERFKNSELEKKKEILRSIGWNHELKDKKLSIISHPWLETIGKHKEHIQAQIERLELGNTLTSQMKQDIFNLLRPSLCTLVDEVGTNIQHEYDTN